MISHTVRPDGDDVVAELRLNRAHVLGHWQANPAQFANRLADQLLQVQGSILSTLEALTIEGEVGTVKFFDDTKGWGIITISSADEVFVHWKGIKGEGHRTLASGERVRFLRREGRNHTYEAIDVERLHKEGS